MRLKFYTQWFFFLLTIVLFSTQPTRAALFANQFLEFELPAQWQCTLEGAEWVCQSTDEAKKRDAIIILAAKLKGDQDSLDQYLDYLKSPKSYTSVSGKPIKSEVKFARDMKVKAHSWVDSLHIESEIPGFLTRYLATVKMDIAVLVTFSVNRDKYSQYQADIENLVNSLKVFRKAGGLNARPQNSNLFDTNSARIGGSGVNVGTIFGGGPDSNDQNVRPKPKKKDDTLLYILIAAAVGIGIFVLKKKRR